MRINYREPRVANYVYIAPNNQVHLMLPIVGGVDIGTDNTCQTVIELQRFFGLDAFAETRRVSALHELLKYKRALQFDISILPTNSEIRREKETRLRQIERYITTLQSLQNHQNLARLQGAYPEYPDAINTLLARKENAVTIKLMPQFPDHYLRAPAASHVFGDNSGRITLRDRLLEAFGTSHQYPNPDLRAQLIARLSTRFTANRLSIYQEQLPSLIHEIVGGERIDFNHDAQGIVIDDAYLRDILCFDGTESPSDYIEGLINACATNLWETLPSSPFSGTPAPHSATRADYYSVLTQFYLAIINSYCHTQHLANTNFNTILNNNASLCRTLSDCALQALRQGNPVEEAIFAWINQNFQVFGLTQPLATEAKHAINTRFRALYTTIKNSPHFDEFIIFDKTQPGSFHDHQGRICVDFSVFLREGFEQLFRSGGYHDLAQDTERLPGHLHGTNDCVGAYFEETQENIVTQIRQLLENSTHFDSAVEFLLADTDTEQKVFERLTPTQITQLSQTPNWGEFMRTLPSHVSNQQQLDSLQRYLANGQTTLLITPEMAYQFYVAALYQHGSARVNPNYHSVAGLRAILEQLGLQVRVEQALQNGFTLHIAQENLPRARTILTETVGQIYISPAMAESIYKEVARQFGENSPEYQAMNRLRNTDSANQGLAARRTQTETPNKLMEAFRLLHLTMQQITFPQQGRGLDGYIVSSTNPQLLAQLVAIHRSHSLFHLTPALARVVYLHASALPRGNELSSLNNQDTPAKIMRALDILGIRYQTIRFNQLDGYLVDLPEESRQTLLGLEQTPIHSRQSNILTTARRDHVTFPPPSSTTQATRGFAPNERTQQAPEPRRHREGTANPRALPSQMANTSQAYHITLERVDAFRSENSTLPAEASEVTLFCPPPVLVAFRQLLRDTGMLGASYWNPYTNQSERLPQRAEELTARHLQILARNEHANVDGTMNLSLYQDRLNEQQVATLRALVTATVIVGRAQANRIGGYGTPLSDTDPQQIIVVDQAGLQWQESCFNTGGMFFYPETYAELPHGYRDWQQNTFRAIYGTQRPESPSHSRIITRWNNIPGILDLTLVTRAIETEFIQALHAVGSIMSHEPINFKYLPAGMGFFSSGLAGDSATPLKIARLTGIANALLRIEQMTPATRASLLGHIEALELPFSNLEGALATELLTRITRSLNHLGLHWFGAENIDCLTPQVGYLTATTNCGDPHAMPGNEGGYQSVDAMISSNAQIDHLNAAYNPWMRQTPATWYHLIPMPQAQAPIQAQIPAAIQQPPQATLRIRQPIPTIFSHRPTPLANGLPTVISQVSRLFGTPTIICSEPLMTVLPGDQLTLVLSRDQITLVPRDQLTLDEYRLSVDNGTLRVSYMDTNVFELAEYDRVVNRASTCYLHAFIRFTAQNEQVGDYVQISLDPPVEVGKAANTGDCAMRTPQYLVTCEGNGLVIKNRETQTVVVDEAARLLILNTFQTIAARYYEQPQSPSQPSDTPQQPAASSASAVSVNTSSFFRAPQRRAATLDATSRSEIGFLQAILDSLYHQDEPRVSGTSPWSAGVWHTIMTEPSLEVGVSRQSGDFAIATNDYQIQRQPNGSLICFDKNNSWRELRNTSLQNAAMKKLKEHYLIAHIACVTEHTEPGEWSDVTPTIEVGRSRFSRNPAMAFGDYQIECQQNSLIVLRKSQQYCVVVDEQIRQYVFNSLVIALTQPATPPVPQPSASSN